MAIHSVEITFQCDLNTPEEAQAIPALLRGLGERITILADPKPTAKIEPVLDDDGNVRERKPDLAVAKSKLIIPGQ